MELKVISAPLIVWMIMGLLFLAGIIYFMAHVLRLLKKRMNQQ